MVGYSEKSLRDKLGLKHGSSAVFLYAPLSYIEALGELDDIEIYPTVRQDHDFVHLFVKDKKVFEELLPQVKNAIKDNGSIWISWPKKTSKVETDMTENMIRDICLPMGLVDIKVAAIDDMWSGLKLVIRKEHR